MKDQLVIGWGEALWDVLPSGKKMGGAPANFAYHVSQFGIDSIAVSALGDDELGRELLSKYEEAGLNVYMQTVDCPTGTVQVTIDKKGIPNYDICQGVAWDNIAWTEEMEAIAKKATVVCFGSLAQRNSVSRDTIAKFLDCMPRDNDHMRVFDINLRQSYYSKELIDANLRSCDVLKINDEEIIVVKDLFAWTETDLKAIARRLLTEYDLRMVILTCGAEGSFVFSPSEESEMKTPKVEVRDTVGAGDSFTAAFIAAILKGCNIRKAHELAVNVSAYVCTQDGAMPPLPEDFRVL